MYQAKLFENEQTRPGERRYGGSVHYHYMSSNSSLEAHNGAKMVHSTITEMIANVSSHYAPTGSFETKGFVDKSIADVSNG